jgi:hypothetical protein
MLGEIDLKLLAHSNIFGYQHHCYRIFEGGLVKSEDVEPSVRFVGKTCIIFWQ